ncbi:MAG: type IV pilus modification PilV family protein [Candidatus Sericytochromatia bacterium]
MKISSRSRQRGFTVIETLIAATVLSLSIASVSTLQSQVLQETRRNNDRAFATQKATQMFEELRSFVQSNREEPLKSLQDYFSNGSDEFVPALTTEKRQDPSAPNNRRRDMYIQPDDPLSGNQYFGSNGQWKYVRQVLVEPLSSDPNARHVTVKVWYGDAGNRPINKERPLATITGILKTNIDQTPPTEVFDMYILALENMPGWWVDVSTLRPIFDRTIDDLAARNPGLEIRKHYISRLGYGRDPFYTPFINTQDDTRDTAYPFVYFYPGNISESSTKPERVRESYVDSLIAGRRRNDVSSQDFNIFKAEDAFAPNADNAGDNYRKYSMADQFNTILRYPEELAMYNRLNTEHLEANTGYSKQPLEPSLRLLLEGMNTQSDSYRNSMLINLHGELVPLPPVRNYADPARVPCDETMENLSTNTGYAPYTTSNVSQESNPCVDPTENLSPTAERALKEHRYRNMRVVTHPEKITYANNEQVNLRVYAYQTVPLGSETLPSLVTSPLSDFANALDKDSIEKISVFIPTNGKGKRSSDPTKTGFLDNPSINSPSSMIGNIKNTLRVTKIVGNNRVGYYKRTAKTQADTLNRAFDTTTDTDYYYVSAVTGLTAVGDTEATTRNANVQLIRPGIDPATTIATPTAVNSGRLFSNIPANSTQFVMRIKTGSALTTAETNDLNSLVDELVVLDAQWAYTGVNLVSSLGVVASNDREVVRISDWSYDTSNGRVTFTLHKPTTKAHSAPALGNLARGVVARHRDYEVVSDIFTPFNSDNTTPGVMVNLFDTLSRAQVCTDDNAAGNGAVCEGTTANTGLRTDRRLYRQEYHPSPIGSDFSKDLTVSSNDNKNTARWVIGLTPSDISSEFQNKAITFETRMARRADEPNEILEEGLSGDGDTHEVENMSTPDSEYKKNLRPNLYNISRTYVWMGNATVPATENFQYMGDPRFMPYVDLKTRTGAHGYNPNFQGSLNSNGYSGLTTTGPSMGSATADVDFIRYGRLYVDGMMRSNSIYNSISGYSNYYYGLGGDMGADGNNTQFYVNLQPFSEGSNTGNAKIDAAPVPDISGQTKAIFSARSGGVDNTRWYGISWQGDMFPDEEYSFWKFNGNLPTQAYNSGNDNLCPTGSKNFCTTPAKTYWRSAFNTAPLSLSGRNKVTSNGGSPTFMNGNTSGSGNNNFGHVSDDSAYGKLTNVAGGTLNRAFNLSLEAEPKAARPFALNLDASKPTLYTDSNFMSGVRNKLELMDVNTGLFETNYEDDNVFYFKRGNEANLVSAIVKISRANVGEGFMLVNGLSKTQDSSETSIARFSTSGMLQAYMNGGDIVGEVGDASSRTRPIPRIEITSPTSSDIYEDAENIQIEFKTNWLRWDMEKYAPSYPSNWYDTVKTQYIFKYSEDAGKNWKYLDNSPATAEGIYDASKVFSTGGVDRFDVPGGQGGLTLNADWDVTDKTSTYLLRVECYRIEGSATKALTNGYSYHQVYVTLRNNS